MLDFSSALYLGLRHGSHDLRPFGALTTGTPAALREPREAASIAADLADLVGVERATLARSTLHAFWDLFTVFGSEPARVLADAGSYPIAHWGAERARLRGAQFITFRHHAPDALEGKLGSPTRNGRTWIVVDGFCTGCGRLAPLADYLALARKTGARLVVDDTQALGVLGEGRSPQTPYGCGGGGSLRATASAAGSDLLLVSSLAKGFGAPLTMIGGDRAAIERFEAMSQTRVHASPPTLADLRAAERALSVNREEGDRRRFRLVSLVARLRRGLRRLGLDLTPTWFPLQSVRHADEIGLTTLYRRLGELGVKAVLRRPVCSTAMDLAFLVTAGCLPEQLDDTIAAVASALSGTTAPARVRLGHGPGHDHQQEIP